LIFNISLEVLKNIKHIRLIFKKINPSEFGVIINENKVISKIIDGHDWSWSPYITVNKFKRLRSNKIRFIEW